jgi:hypothetical protein
VVDAWGDELTPEERDAQEIAERKAAQRSELQELRNQPGFGSWRSARGGFFFLTAICAICVWLAYTSVSGHPGPAGWVGGAIFSLTALYIAQGLARGTFRLIRTGNTQKEPRDSHES